MRRCLFLFALVVYPWLRVAAADGLELLCELDGRTLPVTGVEQGRPLLRDGDKVVAALEKAHWQLRGDIRAAVHTLHWSPVYSIQRRSGPDRIMADGSPFVANVSLRHHAVLDFAGKPTTSELLQYWPRGADQETLVVFVWLVRGQAAKVQVNGAPNTDEQNLLTSKANFDLTDEEAALGQPAVALWRAGAFMAPTPMFPTPAGQEALTAVIWDDAEALRAALAAGARPADRAQTGATLAHFAAEGGTVAALEVLLAADPKVTRATVQRESARADEGTTPLHWAASKGRADAVRSLLRAHAHKNAATKSGQTPLLAACEHGHAAAAQALLDVRPAVDHEDLMHHTPLSVAIDRGDVAIADLLRHAGATFRKTEQAALVLHTQARLGHVGMVRWLIERGVSPRAERRSENVIFAGAQVGDPALIDLLVKPRVPVDQANDDGMTPLMAAITHGRLEYASHLIDAGASVTAQNARGFTPLHLAALFNAPAIAELLLKHGAELAPRSARGLSPLEMALIADSAEMVEFLVVGGERIDIRHASATVIIEAAIRLDAGELIKRAINDGWSPAQPLSAGWSPARVAEVLRANKVVAVLRDAGFVADPTQPLPVVSASQLDAQIRATQLVLPDDPRATGEEYEAQSVDVEFLIGGDGQPLFPRIKTCPDRRLRSAVLSVVEHWRFAPLTRQGQPVATRAVMPVHFLSSSQRAFTVSQIDEMPQAIKRVVPRFPPGAVLRGREARVVVEFIVTREGSCQDIRVLETTGDEFSREAIESLKKWTFKPGAVDGKPVPVKIVQPIIFNIER